MADTQARMVGTEEAARELEVSARRVRTLCETGIIVGAVLTDRGWLMPSPVKRRAARRSRGRPRSSGVPEVSDSSDSLTLVGSAAGPDEIDLPLIRDNPHSPRTGLTDDQVERLADDIHDRGLLTPLTLRPVIVDDVVSYEVVSGTRRLAAIRLLISRSQWEAGIPAHVRPMSDSAMVLDMLADHGHRVDPDVVSDARLALSALENDPGLELQDMADAMGISVKEFRYRQRLLRLPESVLARIASGEVPIQAARPLLSLHRGGHAHHDVAGSVISHLVDGPKTPPYNATSIAREMAAAFARDGWYRLTPYIEQRWAQELKVAATTHTLAGGEVWTCDHAAAMSAIRAHTSAVRHEQRMERIRQDPVVRMEAPDLGDVDDLTDVQRDALGTRVGDVPDGGWWTPIDGEGYWSPPLVFDREECYTSCVQGAVVTTQGIVCTDSECFGRKLSEGAARMRARIDSDDATPYRNRQLLESTEIALSGHGRIEQVAPELSAYLLGQGVALVRRPVAAPNLNVDARSRTTSDPLQEDIRDLLGTGPPARSDHMWDVEEAQRRARQLPGQRVVRLLQLLVSYAVDPVRHREIVRLRELPPSIVEVTVTDSDLQARLDDGRTISVPLTWVPWLVYERSELRKSFELRDNGLSIHWPTRGESIRVEELLAHGLRRHI